MIQEELIKIRQKLNKFLVYLDIDKKKKELSELEARMTDPSFWNDRQKSKEVIKRVRDIKFQIMPYEKVLKEFEEICVLSELADTDESIFSELQIELEKITGEIAEMEFKAMLSGEHDSSGAIVSIHPGAGGTESQDWAQMLMRMYIRWFERKGYAYDVVDLQPGEEAGIKSVTITVSGEYAYGYLKSEIGVHRLVRISPFDANKRRHTSFASVFVYPEIEDNVEIIINPVDLRIDTFRAGGKGGQHVNKTDSAVRITHIPTGIVVQCQNERSQLNNKAKSLKILRARLFDIEQQKKEAQKEKLSEVKKDISWGNQIRSYTFHPYQLIKDHRTEYETGNVSPVMDGDIDMFVEAYLKKKPK
ncbi:peptide chain release factor 2 [Candidatus Desantisbacteria bacterium]|nr:peptide chain release factor 2 [Candidatus Desantisbacteria bacterium]